MRASATGIAIVLLLTAALPTVSAAVTRGPYLQMATPNAISVRWRTDTAHIGRVRYGANAASLTASVDEAASRGEHEVRITGLTANTSYSYSIGTTTATLAGDASYTFVTPPTVGTSKATRIWVIGDAGTADANQRAVRDAYLAHTGSRGTDLWLMLGDNAYNDGTDAEYQAAVFAMYPSILRQSPVWPTIGNHDAHLAPPAYLSIFTLPNQAQAGGVASGTENYYSFDYANIHFVCLDSQLSSRSTIGAMATWLRNDLAATAQRWIVVFWHHPPYTKGSHDSDTETQLIEMRQNFLPIIEDHGVDLMLSGHSHSYERSYLIDGHYGSSSTFAAIHKLDGGTGGVTPYAKADAAHEGTVYAVAGSSGKISGGALNHPAMVVSLNQLGSMVLDVSGDRLEARFVRETGAVTDSFAIVKSTVAPTSLDRRIAASSDDAEEAAGSGAVNLTSTDLELSTDGSTVQTVGMRWTSLGIPRGATITKAWVRFACDEIGSSATSLTVRGQAADNAATFAATARSISARAATSPSVTWTPPAWNAVGESAAAQASPDLSPIIQQIVNRPGWAEGNALALIVTGTGRRTADSFDDVSAIPALLHVEWGAASPSSSLAVRPAASADDAEENGSGAVNLTSTDLELTTDGTAVQVIGIRFPALAIPKGSQITSAAIQFTCDETSSGTTSLTIRGQSVDNAAGFTTATGNVSGRARTTANVTWSPAAWSTIGAVGAAQRTPELKAIVQEVVDRAGWQSGNALGVIVTGTGHRCAESFDRGAGAAAQLLVTFVPPPTSGG